MSHDTTAMVWYIHMHVASLVPGPMLCSLGFPPASKGEERRAWYTLSVSVHA